MGRDGEHQHTEESAQGVLGKRLGDLHAALDACHGREPENERGPPADVAVLPLLPGPGRRRRQDRQQRGRLGVKLRESEHEGQRRHEEDSAPDAEEAREHTGHESQRAGREQRRHQMSSQTARPARSAAKASVRVRVASRCWSHVPRTAPAAAGSPTTAAAPGFSSPCSA